MTSVVRKAFAGLLLVGLVSGCSTSVILEAPTIPTPLTDEIPVTVGLRMPANFYDFVHQEEVYGREEWSIDLGNSNASMFTQLFGHMFSNVTVLKSGEDPANYNLDALIEPSIDAFEFSVPNQSKTDSFAVWIRYRIKIYDRAGTLVSNWPVSAYGKSQTASVSNSEALQRAAVLAMRDAAALMIMKMDDATKISSLAKRVAPLPTAAPVAPATDEEELQTIAAEEQDDETS